MREAFKKPGESWRPIRRWRGLTMPLVNLCGAFRPGSQQP
jgi:hypothetical protein